jgi:hypothetical protein
VKSKIEELFELLRNADLEGFRAQLSADVEIAADGKLTADDTNTPYVDKIFAYYYEPYGLSNNFQRSQRQELYLVHEAIRLGNSEGLKIILQLGGNLLLKERIDDRSKEMYATQIKEWTSVSDTALEFITYSQDGRLKQVVFDHLCSDELLYKQPVYFKFITDKLKFASLDKLNAKCLQIDPGKPLPSGFDNPLELKQYLVENGVDITGIFFTKEDYLQHLTTPQQIISEPLLAHALRICPFSLEEIQQIYHAITDDNLRSTILSHTPEADPDYLAALVKLDGVSKTPVKIATQSPALPPTPPSATASFAHQNNPNLTPQVRSHLRSRIEMLTTIVTNLRSKKRGKKEEQEFLKAEASLKYCKGELGDDSAFRRDQNDDDDDFKKNKRQVPRQ